MKRLILLLTLCMLYACDSTSGPGTDSQASTYNVYQVGDSMVYDDVYDAPDVKGRLREVVRVKGAVTINGEVFLIHQLDHDSFYVDGVGMIEPKMDSEYYRSSGSKIYRNYEDFTRSIVDFEVAYVPGKTAEDYQRIEAHFVKDTTVTVPAGIFTTKLVENGELFGMRSFYASGVGLVLQTQGDDYRRELMSAKIGGKVLP